MSDYIAKEKCIPRRVYVLHSRNLLIGVWDERVEGFVGLRDKFGQRYLFVEYHWDNGPPLGTAQPISDIGEMVPPEISLETSLGVIDKITGKPCRFDRAVANGGRGWYNLESAEQLPECQPQAVHNTPLFDFLTHCASRYVRSPTTG